MSKAADMQPLVCEVGRVMSEEKLKLELDCREEGVFDVAGLKMRKERRREEGRHDRREIAADADPPQSCRANY